ncbi:hypothetical protein IKG50_02945 [Candidatus Saccharibacteria bacterium]|nr:hypothetical protein [Candidatus Saccharibacteria bacterium]
MKKGIISPEGCIKNYSEICRFVKESTVGERLYFGINTGNCNYMIFDEDYRYIGDEDYICSEVSWIMKIKEGFIIFANYDSSFWWFTEDPLSLSYTHELELDFMHEQTKELSLPSTRYCDHKWCIADAEEAKYLVDGLIARKVDEIDIYSLHEKWDTWIAIDDEEPLEIPIKICWHCVIVEKDPFRLKSPRDVQTRWCILAVDEERGAFLLDPEKYDPNL